MNTEGPLPLFHMDCYRLGLEEEIQELGLEEYFDGPGISVIEWAERIRDLPEERLEISISILDESRRRIRIKGSGSMVNRLQDWNLKFRIRTGRVQVRSKRLTKIYFIFPDSDPVAFGVLTMKKYFFSKQEEIYVFDCSKIRRDFGRFYRKDSARWLNGSLKRKKKGMIWWSSCPPCPEKRTN